MLSNRQTAIQLAQTGNVPHLAIEEVKELAAAAGEAARNMARDRDPLLIMTIFDGALRVSEALQLTPESLRNNGQGWGAEVVGKGSKYREIALSASIVALLHQFAYKWNIGRQDRLFAITKWRAWQIVNRAFERTGIPKPPGVGTVHVLRHSGALERLKDTGNPHALQEQLGHASARMTLRYMKTLSAEESEDQPGDGF